MRNAARTIPERTVQRMILSHIRSLGLPVFHIPNGGGRTRHEAIALKGDGVVRGVHDLCVPVAFTHPVTQRTHALTWVEVKAGGGAFSVEQLAWGEHFRAQGHFVIMEKGLAPVLAILSFIYSRQPMPPWYLAAMLPKAKPA